MAILTAFDRFHSVGNISLEKEKIINWKTEKNEVLNDLHLHVGTHTIELQCNAFFVGSLVLALRNPFLLRVLSTFGQMNRKTHIICCHWFGHNKNQFMAFNCGFCAHNCYTTVNAH